MGQSKRHHYIPQFYLEGFTNNNGEFFIFDKKKEEIRKSKPINSFFEKYRNSAVVGDERTDLPEQMLSYFDGRDANALKTVRKSEFKEHVLTPEVLAVLKSFIATTFWRIPTNDQLREDIIDNFSFSELGFGIFNKETGKRSQEAEELLKNTDLFRKIYPSLLSITTRNRDDNKDDFFSWKLIHRTNTIHVTGDNPLIFKNDYQDFSSIREELMIPLCSTKVLVHSKKHVPKVLSPVFNLKMDTLIMSQSDRFICSSNKEYLELLVSNFYSLLKSENLERQIIDDLFNYFY